MYIFFSISNCFLLGSYICFATNEFGTAASNSVFVRQSTLHNFKETSPKTVSVEEGKPLEIECEAPGGWPKPTVYWMITVKRSFVSIGETVFFSTELVQNKQMLRGAIGA